MAYLAGKDRYSKFEYNRVGNSGLKLPPISLGLWQNFGTSSDIETCQNMLEFSFDNGITHFDLANNYGPEPGSAESNFGKIFKEQLSAYRDEMIISTKAGYDMWQGPYGDFGSKKYLVASLNQSLKRMNLDYVDIFYHHRADPNTDIVETAVALDLIVKQGKALYIGISNYNAEQTVAISAIFKELKTPFIIHQAKYNIFDSRLDGELTDVLLKQKKGCIVFSPLQQGILTNRYIKGIPEGSRVTHSRFLNVGAVTSTIAKVKQLNEIALKRGQSLAQMAIAWVFNNKAVTSALIGASSISQIQDNLNALSNLTFSQEELTQIQQISQDK